jgi:hypothetical protein
MKDIWRFIVDNKKFVILPIVIVLVTVGVLSALASSTVVAPFIYSLF